MRHALGALLALALACSPPAAVSTPAPAPAPQPAPTPTAPAAPAPSEAETIREAPRDWQLLDEQRDRIPGISLAAAERELLAGRVPQRTVVVAVIDGGVDTAHADLRANLWLNEDEVAANGKDDDRNGYVDDVRGWNFIGGADGRNVHHDTYEVARLHARCTSASGGARSDTLPAALRRRCPEISAHLERERNEAEQTLERITQIEQTYAQIIPILQRATGSDSLSVASVTAVRPTDGRTAQARSIYLELAANGITPKVVDDAGKAYRSRLEYGLDPSFDPRDIVGDRYRDVQQTRYGNSDVTGPDASHGTHVAGVIAAVRGNGIGIDGIAPAVRIMAVRAVPDGDERDKDVANAIRYAVDNGAHIINMSFGKPYSPEKSAVDAAARYAESKGVLLVHAAGNDGEDLAQRPSFPNPVYASGGRHGTWIEVGASSWVGRDSLAAAFTNYGREQVDVFAPGVDILSTVPGDAYERNSGTSIAAPVVSGLAALLMSYFPDLTASQVRKIILDSATRYGEQVVVRPGLGDAVRFDALSATGGIVNARAAIRMAQSMSSTTP